AVEREVADDLERRRVEHLDAAVVGDGEARDGRRLLAGRGRGLLGGGRVAGTGPRVGAAGRAGGEEREREDEYDGGEGPRAVSCGERHGRVGRRGPGRAPTTPFQAGRGGRSAWGHSNSNATHSHLAAPAALPDRGGVRAPDATEGGPADGPSLFTCRCAAAQP